MALKLKPKTGSAPVKKAIAPKTAAPKPPVDDDDDEPFPATKPEPAKPFPKKGAADDKAGRPKKDGGNHRAASIDGGWLISGVSWINLHDIETISVRAGSGDNYEVGYGLRSGRSALGRVGTRDEAYAEAAMVVAAIKEL